MEQRYVERNLALAEALESGEYMQATEALRTEEGFCCLGVACDLFKKATGRGKWAKDNQFVWKGMPYSGEPPEAVSEWYGWNTDIPSLTIKGEVADAIYHNDKYKRTFKQIAKGFRALAKAKPAKALAI